MKKTLMIVAGLLAGVLGFTACSSDKNEEVDNSGDVAGESLVCVEQLIDGCIDIAGEVGTSKIGDPYDLYVSGQKTNALYAVESWYSWHSRDDYSNNILSIRNAYYGSRDGSIASKSLATLIASKNASLDTQMRSAIEAAKTAILSIPLPQQHQQQRSRGCHERLRRPGGCAQQPEGLSAEQCIGEPGREPLPHHQ
jgi:hypothetical protein